MDFTIANTSTIDTYMRIGYIPVYRDESGNDLAKDVSGLKIDCSTLKVGDLPVSAQPVSASINGCEKEFLQLMDGDGYYLVVPAGESASGTLAVSGEELVGLNIILTAEAIQATRKAAEAAGAFGWDARLAERQASGIASPEVEVDFE
jgi:hypothetical protein